MMKLKKAVIPGFLAMLVACANTSADERRFTYTYEPETLPKGALEYEQWITLRTQKNEATGKDNFNRWDLREELEYGATDRYTVALYLNQKAESYRNPATGMDYSEFGFEGIAMENRYMVLNPAEYAVGMTLYLEPQFSGEEAELEQKVILGQRYGDWKWALNLTHATEWEDNFHETEGETGLSFGVARDLSPNWALGIELLNVNKIPEYERWESSAVFLGPAVSYHKDKWWGALSVMPQIYGANYLGDPDGDNALDLEGHERVNIRLIIGINF